MKASELSRVLLDIVAQHGDLEVGIQDSEFGCFMGIESFSILKATEHHDGMSDDAESLGNDLFVGITGTYLP